MVKKDIVSHRGKVKPRNIKCSAGYLASIRTITGNHQEFIIISDLMNSHIGVRRHNLLLRRQLCALLEFEVTNGTGQSQVAIDTTKVNKTTGGADTSFLAYKSSASEHAKTNVYTNSNSKYISHEPSFCGL